MTNDHNSPLAEQPPRILLVDDNPDNLRILHATLDGRGFNLRVANCADAALEVARNARPDLMLLDIVMPGTDGYEVCRRIKDDAATRDIAVIFLSAMDDMDAKVRGFQLGAVDFIAKPFQAEEVLARVNTHVTIQRLQQQLLRRNQELELANARLERAHQRMKRDLEAAASFQKTLLPSADHVTRNLQISWAYRPCDELAGDSLNFVRLDDDRTAVFVFDVAGHGVRASLLSVAVTYALLPKSDGSTLLFPSSQATPAELFASPASVAERLNTYFELNESNSRFFTLVFGIIDTRDESFTYVNAGHPSPLLARRNDSIEALNSTGPPIGPIPAYPFTERRTGMESGDRLLLYTDGLPDEMNDSNERFGVERIKELLRKSWDVPLPQLVDRLEREVVTWSETGSLNDDLSILAVERVENCNQNP